MPVWADALKAVDQSPYRIRGKEFAQAKLYVFPEPALFVTPMNNNKKLSFLRTWIQAHAAILWRAETQSLSAVSAQTWRDFLAMDFIQTEQCDETRTAKWRAQLRKLMGSAIERPGVKESSARDTRLMQWRNTTLRSDVMPPQTTVQAILWELYELNFCSELVALDLHMSNGTHGDLIAACFLGSDVGLTYIMVTNLNCGLVADEWRVRLPYVKALINIMCSWNIRHPHMFSLVDSLVQSITKDQFLELERTATHFYTQCFFDVFGRAAIIPHHITV
ncbi:hypothetical protein APHAL10511_004257 [Amanita phalloides]|nr:hypothetical protein APHAL10511_004257 [Amanita phalloides]